MTDMTPDIKALNDEANDLFGEILHGRATVEQIARFELVVAGLQEALTSTERVTCADDGCESYGGAVCCNDITIDREALDQWYDSRARDFDVIDDVPF